MKITLYTILLSLSLTLPSYGTPPAGTAGEKIEQPKQIIAVKTDYKGNPSDISTDEIYLELRDGSKEYLTENGTMERVPKFSADNKYIAFLRRKDSNEDGKVDWKDNCELWLLNLANRKEEWLTEGLTDASMPTWHPTLPQVAFMAGEKVRNKTLYIHDLPTGKRREVMKGVSSWPTWSPDGDYIAFYDKQNGVALTSPDGKQTKTLSDGVGNGWALYWTYDNRLIFTHEKLGWQIYDPNEKKLSPLDKKKHAGLKTVDQEIYDWANEGEQKPPEGESPKAAPEE